MSTTDLFLIFSPLLGLVALMLAAEVISKH